MRKGVRLTELKLDKKINKIRENCWENFVSCRTCDKRVRDLCGGGCFNSDKGISLKTVAEIEEAYDILTDLKKYEKEDYKGEFKRGLNSTGLVVYLTLKGIIIIWEGEEYEGFEIWTNIKNEELSKFKYLKALKNLEYKHTFAGEGFKYFECVPERLVEQLYLFMKGE